MRNPFTKTLLPVLLAAMTACSTGGDDALDFPVDPGDDGKTDVFGRRLAGVASDYEAADLDEDVLVNDARARRDAAWTSVAKILEDVPLLGLIETDGEHEDVELPEGEIPRVPRFQTWYGVDDIKRMFQYLYERLDPSERAVRRAFTDEEIADAVEQNAYALDRSKRWPLERYLRYVRDLGLCPEDMSDDECVALVQQKLAGAVGGNARILYSPATAEHILDNYSNILDCLANLDSVSLDMIPAVESNFTLCFGSEFPVNGVLVKAQWARADFDRTMPAFDTTGEALTGRLSGSANWGDTGDRQVDPEPGEIFTIRLRNGDTYRLVGLHIMTKELRHWQWITLWWSDEPDSDFGADRPGDITDGLGSVWSNYKMCVVDSFDEGDPDAPGRFEDTPSLAAALRAIDNGAGGPTWCSNPYLEHGRNNARTNCIGCHQHGGSTVAIDVDDDGTLDTLDLEAIIGDEINFPEAGRLQIRELFPADYLYSFNRVDDFASVIRGEVSYFDGTDADSIAPRVDAILALDGTAEAGDAWFSQNCAACHGPTGEGNGFAPNLYDRVPNRDDRSILKTLIQGRGGMPSWGGTFTDQQLADLLAHLRVTFGTYEE